MKSRQKTVTLSTGQKVTVQVMQWRAYVRLKNQVIEQLGGSLGSLLAEFLTSTQGELAFTPEVTAKYLPRLLSQINGAIDDNTEALIRASLVSLDASPLQLDLESLPPTDWLDLRDAAAAVNDLEDLIAKEKNCFAAALAKAATFFQTPQGTPSGSGGPDTKQP